MGDEGYEKKEKVIDAALRKTLADMSIDELVDARLGYAIRLKQAESHKDTVDLELRDRLAREGFQIGQSYVREDGVSVNIATRTTKTINKTLLLSKGVDSDVIDECTDVSISEPFLTVRVPKAKKEKG